HLVTVGNKRLLLDCGIFQGRRQEARELNRQFVAPPASIQEVVLSHTHNDHYGNLPNLAKNGFQGPIHCTSATADLAALLLRDSAYIQEQDAMFLNRKLERKGAEPIEPLYTITDAENTLPQLRPYLYQNEFQALDGAVVGRFRDAGHVLGSA